MKPLFNRRGGLDALVSEIADRARSLPPRGRVASYIPALASVDAGKFGIAVATLDGHVATAGDAAESFSIQSISKLFSLALACKTIGNDLWSRVGRTPSANQFNSLIELEMESGKPRNPFVNAGALVVADCLGSRFVQMERSVVQLLREQSGNMAIDYDRAVARSELSVAHRNMAAAYLMKSLGNFVNPVEEVLKAYCAQCAICCSCIDLARAALFLTNHGICPSSGQTILSPVESHQLCALMMSSGTYEASGETSFTVGLPVKSGVGGGLLGVIPGYGAICVWSPALDKSGTSVAGLEALQFFVAQTQCSVFL